MNWHPLCIRCLTGQRRYLPQLFIGGDRGQLGTDTATHLLRCPPVDRRVHVEQVAIVVVQFQAFVTALGGHCK